ncbi:MULTISPECIES: SDR family oxidoreductase [unclassified Crossiella]|uniref:SDR family oxidoreductase n=1 Tax=unclassified Crossiella TaxID=2620835 RepID=UPI001FFF8172|nr:MULTISPECIES: SDR family oxidoreductase [unclassified Crossiella]MCK2241692.1 SDR family oxidoreductase [Crossiella sp. S99.2]MCK2255436.1 SDR family oxidoreductase [Crossiella sp. S99.1]
MGRAGGARSFEGRHVVITGGSSGIGLATARLLAARGARLSLLARTPERLDAAVAELRELGARALAVPVDVTDQVAVQAAIRLAGAEFGPCDVLITCAGIARPGHFGELADQVFRETVEVDYFGTLWPIRAVAPEMVRRGSGSIVGVSSMLGMIGIFGYTAYAPAKFAVRGLLETLGTELRPHGVHVGCVYPPDVDTPQLAYENQFKPAETHAISGTVRPMTAEAVAGAIVRGIQRRSVTIVPDRQAGLLTYLAAVCPPLIRYLIDRKVRRARRG